MRTLRFIVDEQIIKQDPACDFTNLVPGSEGYLQLEFVFSKEWDGCKKAVGFYSPMGTEYSPQFLGYGKSCIVPAEATKKKTFYIRVVGKRDDFKITTNKVAVSQNGG